MVNIIEKSGLFIWICSNLFFSYIDISLFSFWFEKNMELRLKIKYMLIMGISKMVILKCIGYPYGDCVNFLITVIFIKFVLKEESKQKCFVGGLVSELPKFLIDVSTVVFISINSSIANISNYITAIEFLNLAVKLVTYHLKEILIIEKGRVKFNELEAYNENLSRTE